MAARAARCPIARRFRSSDTSPACRRLGIRKDTSSKLLARCPRSARGERRIRRICRRSRANPRPGSFARRLCTEVRGGVLRVFMPPQHYLEDYLELVAAIEDTAADLGLPVLVEGYAPPHDPRLNAIKVTPDPGVIEVNTNPVGSWDDLVRNTDGSLRRSALEPPGHRKIHARRPPHGHGRRQSHRRRRRRLLPIRRCCGIRACCAAWSDTGTTIPRFRISSADFLSAPPARRRAWTRPATIRSTNSKSLSSKSRRTSQRRRGPSIAFSGNLLVDATGNTHRAEFCIDKLYSPDSASGRLGLLEMRAFEMPPHARMSLTQHLLLRSLIATFWKQPYREESGALANRNSRPLHAAAFCPAGYGRRGRPISIEPVIRYDLEWFAPHFEFRFPLYGTIEHRGIELELRQAIEPWHVLGEEAAAGGTVRYVDSSVERLQVLVNGMVDSRHVITCNGHRVPLHPTGTNGQFVAGVRYRAWQPPSCLHPTIGIHSPLVFDIVDNWSGRSIGGCTYHVAHPGGRSYERFPVNAYEAEAAAWSGFSSSDTRRARCRSVRRRSAKNFRSRSTCGHNREAQVCITPIPPEAVDTNPNPSSRPRPAITPPIPPSPMK